MSPPINFEPQDAIMACDLKPITRREAIIALLKREDRALFAKLHSKGVLRVSLSKTKALSFHISTFLDQIPFPPSCDSSPKSSPKTVAFNEPPPGRNPPSGELKKEKKKIYGVLNLPTLTTHKEYTCREATQPLTIPWPKAGDNLTESNPPTCQMLLHDDITRSCTEYDAWVRPAANLDLAASTPNPCLHTRWYGAITALSNLASQMLSRTFTRQNITTLHSPILNKAEVRTIELNCLPRLCLAYSLYTARIFITGRYKKIAISLCKIVIPNFIHEAQYILTVCDKPWDRALVVWLAAVKEVYNMLRTMELWLEEAVEKMERSVRYLGLAGLKKESLDGEVVPEKDVVPAGELVPMYQCLREVKGAMRRCAIEGIREDEKKIRDAVGRLMDRVHPLTGLGNDKDAKEFLEGLWALEEEEDEESDDNDDDNEDEEEEEKGDESDDEMEDDEMEDDESDDESDEGEDELFSQGIEGSMNDGGANGLAGLNDDLEGDFDRELRKQKPVIVKAILTASADIRAVCEQWRSHLAFI